MLILIIAFVLVLLLAEPGKNSFENVTVIAIVGVVAVAIERLMESFWIWIGLTKGTFWPLNVMGKLDSFVTDMDDKLQPLYGQADKILKDLKTKKKISDETAERVQTLLDSAQKPSDWLKVQAPGHQKVRALTARADATFKFLSAAHEEFEDLSKQSEAYIDSVSDFVATFKDNPARRLISIVLGAILGLVIAGFLKLDIAVAAGEVELYKGLGVALTGLLMRLGATPTHEVIRSLQEYKKSRKKGNV